jgi:hypothetical protein
MEPSYSVLADALSKFHTSPEWIQALWLVAVPVTVLGSAYCVMRAAKEIAVAALNRREELQGRAIYAIYQSPDGRWLLYARGAVRELKGDDLAENGMAMPLPRPH